MKRYIPRQYPFRHQRFVRRRWEGSGTALSGGWCAFVRTGPEPNPGGRSFNCISLMARVVAAVRAGRVHGVPLSITRDGPIDSGRDSECLVAVGRYAIVPRLLGVVAPPALLADVDSPVGSSFDAAIAELQGGDISPHNRPDKGLPRHKVLAITVIGGRAKGTEPGLAGSAETFALLLGRPFTRRVVQLILYLCGHGRAGARRAPVVRLAPMSKRRIEGGFDEGSPAWIANGPEREPAHGVQRRR